MAQRHVSNNTVYLIDTAGDGDWRIVSARLTDDEVSRVKPLSFGANEINPATLPERVYRQDPLYGRAFYSLTRAKIVLRGVLSQQRKALADRMREVFALTEPEGEIQ